MGIFDLPELDAEGDENRNVFWQNDVFKVRVIALEPGGKIPECGMESWVLFYVVCGDVLQRKNGGSSPLRECQAFISEPALISIESENGTKLMGVLISFLLGLAAAGPLYAAFPVAG